MSLATIVVSTVFVAFLLYHVCYSLLWNPLAKIPGPKSFALTKWRLAYEDYKGARTRNIHRLHEAYGATVRIGPNEVSFNSLTALRQIYGAGSAFGRPESFYHAFDAFGQQHMFTFHSSTEHAARKKIMSQMYSKSSVLKNPVADLIQSKVKQFIDLIQSEPQTASYLDRSLHYFSLDNITWMIYRDSGSATEALTGRTSDRNILSDIGEPSARRYMWFNVHLPMYTKWVMSCGSYLKPILNLVGLLPGKTPLAYSGLQDYALATLKAYPGGDKSKASASNHDGSLLKKLLDEQAKIGKSRLPDLQIAAECADHLDAGLKTTSDSLMFGLWALSLPCNNHYQQCLADEVDTLRESLSGVGDSGSISPASLCDQLPYLDAVIKEILRLYAPIPGSQPRSSTRDTTIDGYAIPAGTIVSCQAYSLHRNHKVFHDPNTFNPDRWLSACETEIAEMRHWWWPFSSGGRMCLGMHLAIAEMKTLLVAIYQRYSTSLSAEFQHISPTAVSRFELVRDNSLPIIEGKELHIEFKRK